MKIYGSAALVTGLMLLAGCSAPPQQQAPAEAPANPPLPPVQAVPLDTAADGSVPGRLPGVTVPVDRSTPEQRAEAEAAAAAAGLPLTNESRGAWTCDNGETIELRFFPDQGVAVLVRGGQNVELQQQPVASGIEYSNGQTTIRGKADELTLTVGMMAPTTCRPAGA